MSLLLSQAFRFVSSIASINAVNNAYIISILSFNFYRRRKTIFVFSCQHRLENNEENLCSDADIRSNR